MPRSSNATAMARSDLKSTACSSSMVGVRSTPTRVLSLVGPPCRLPLLGSQPCATVAAELHAPALGSRKSSLRPFGDSAALDPSAPSSSRAARTWQQTMPSVIVDRSIECGPLLVTRDHRHDACATSNSDGCRAPSGFDGLPAVHCAGVLRFPNCLRVGGDALPVAPSWSHLGRGIVAFLVGGAVG